MEQKLIRACSKLVSHCVLCHCVEIDPHVHARRNLALSVVMEGDLQLQLVAQVPALQLPLLGLRFEERPAPPSDLCQARPKVNFLGRQDCLMLAKAVSSH